MTLTNGSFLTAVLSSALFLGCVDPGPGNDAGTLDAGAACPDLDGTEVTHQGDITASETWAGDGKVHHVIADVTVRPGATLTFAPCAVVKVNGNRVVTITGTAAKPASLVSAGTADRPVLVTTAVAGSPWSVFRGMAASDTFDLAYTTFESGGASSFHGAALDLRGGGLTQSDSVAVLRANHLTIKNSVGTGLVLESAAAFTTDSTDVTVTGGGGTVNGGDYAIEISPIAAGSLPNLTISGNAHDAIRIAAGSLYISRDLTLKNLGVPYFFAFDRVRVTDQTGAFTPTLTIEAGVELRFEDYLLVGYNNAGVASQPGKLIAIGTAAKPIIFTSGKATRAAGDWPGIWLMNAPGSRLEHVEINYAGGPNLASSSNCKPSGSSDNAALFISFPGCAYIPAAGDFVSVSISNSASHGINAMWQSGAFGPDVTAGFSFTAISGCRQTQNRLNGTCTSQACLVP